MSANYNNAAWFYDGLSRLVYGRSLVHAQVYLLPFIPAGSKVLLVGGGTGWILGEIAKIYPSGLHITYVEIAKAMMEKSKERNTGGNKVEFINEPVEQVNFSEKFDIVLTPFLLDNFTQDGLTNLFNHIHCTLKPNGLWLNASFHKGNKWWHKLMLNSMILFFRLICGIEAKKFPDIDKQFDSNGYKAVEEKCFYGDFIQSRVYKK